MVDAGGVRRRKLDGPDYVGRDGNIARSDDERLLDELRRRPGSPTYAIANSIGLRGQTALVRRRLRRLEERGLVRSGVGQYFPTYVSWWAR